jgi:hypothetical protein
MDEERGRQTRPNVFKPLSEVDKDKVNKNIELLNIQEFKHENIRSQFKEIEENKDFFAFTYEDDPKYDYLKVKNMFNSRLMFKALIWSNVVSAAYTLHRYSRTHNLKKSILGGSKLFILCFMPIWGSFEIRPHLTMWYYTKFLDRLSYEKQLMFNSYNYLEGLKAEHERLEKSLGVRIPITEKQTVAIILGQYNYENYVLKSFNYKQMDLNQFVREKDDKEILEGDLNENEMFGENVEDERFDYDFSVLGNIKASDLCAISGEKFFDLEKLDLRYQVGRDKMRILRSDVLHNGSRERLLNAIMKAEDYLSKTNKRGNFEEDPDYLKC